MSTHEGPDQEPPAPEPAPGPTFNPQSGHPVPPGYPYGQAPYPQAPYGQPPYGQAPYGQAPYPVPGWPGYQLPEHPKANLALILGLIAVPGSFATCGLAILTAPFAWFFAVQARREMRLAPGRYGGEAKVTAGLVLGIIGTVLLALGLLAIAVVIAFAVTGAGSFDTGTNV